MHLVRRFAVIFMAASLLVFALAAVAGAEPGKGPRNYTILVGAESAHRGVDVMSFFPDQVRIHVGDTVHWVQNSNEIHTVTFLGTSPLPDLIVPAGTLGLPDSPSPLVFNPAAVSPTTFTSLGDTTTYVNSGLMGREQGQARSFDLTFTATGTYHYLCIVHGTMMSGTITVVGDNSRVATPGQTLALGRQAIARELAKAPAVLRQAMRQEHPATHNADGTWTHHISIGYSQGQIDLMRFFPSVVHVRPGDAVEWTMAASDRAPHTVTFLNGLDEPGLVTPVPQPPGPPVLYVNPALMFPAQPGAPLTRMGIFNSGLLQPGMGASYSLVVGNIGAGLLPYLCLLHDTSGMKGTLVVLRH